MQEFHRTCQASRCSSGGHNQKSSRTKRRKHGRGGGCRAKVVTVAGGAHRTPEVADLQRQVAELVRERDQLRQGVSKSLRGEWVRRRGAGFVSGASPCHLRVFRT